MERNIENEIVEVEKQILVYKERLDLVSIEHYNLKKKSLEVSELVRQAKMNLSRLKSQKDILTREYWIQKA